MNTKLNHPLMAALLFLTGVQLELFAMWFDMEVNRDLKVRLGPGAKLGG